MKFEKIEQGFYIANAGNLEVSLTLQGPTKRLDRHYAIEVVAGTEDALKGVVDHEDRYGCTLKDAKAKAEELVRLVKGN